MLEAGLPVPAPPPSCFMTGMPQDLTVEAVFGRQADAGFVRTGVFWRPWRMEGKLDLTRIKVIHRQDLGDFPYISSTRLYPEWPMVVMPQVDARLARQLAVALLSLPADSARPRPRASAASPFRQITAACRP